MAEQSEQQSRQDQSTAAPVKVGRTERITLAGVTQEISGPDQVGSVIGSMFHTAQEKILAAGGEPGAAISIYDMPVEGEDRKATFTVGFQFEQGPVDGLLLTELPAGDAAVLVHRGAMDSIGRSWGTLHAWLEGQDEWAPTGLSREVYVSTGPDLPQEQWVTQLVQPVEPAVVAQARHLQDNEVQPPDEEESTAEAAAEESSGQTADDSPDSESTRRPDAENDDDDAPQVSEPGA